MEQRVDVVVVGGGLIGSAAARHLSEAGQNVVVLAAPEPVDWSEGVGPFASHYDAGRITRIMASDPVWAEMAARSTARYADIATRSGVDFHTPRGLAWLGVDVDDAVSDSRSRGADLRYVEPDWLLASTGIRMPQTAGLQCAFEAAPAGFINPRNLAAAELRLAELAGATVLRCAADAVVKSASGVTVTSSHGDVIADRVLLATGAYAGDLVGVDLAVQRLLRTTLLVDMGPAVEMPSLILLPCEHPEVEDVYWVPPTQFPDGRVLFKIGCETPFAPRANSVAEINAWFATNGDPVEAAALMDVTRDLLPNVVITSSHTVPCVITKTESGLPYVGWVDDRVAVAVGGNGSSAKSCDEIGRLASTLFAPDGWVDTELDAEQFAPQLA